MATIINGQTCLEARGMEERHNEIVRSDYNIENQYSSTHPDALSNGDSLGKGSGHQGHTHWLPNCASASVNQINYSNFDTSPDSQIGGCYDINGRNGISGRKRAMTVSLYSYESPYGATLIDTSANQDEGQWVFGQQIGTKTGSCG